MFSMFDLYKIGIGPSSSHTVGPMTAGKQFADELAGKGLSASVDRIVAKVHGSLALTGKGHQTDQAIVGGLAGNLPNTVDIELLPRLFASVTATGMLPLAGGGNVKYEEVFDSSNLPLHENGMQILAFSSDTPVMSKIYYSIGGGFIVDEEGFGKQKLGKVAVPYPYQSAEDLLRHCEETGMSFSSVIRENERVLHTDAEISDYFKRVWQTMQASMARGMEQEGYLPGPLKVPRRAAAMRYRLARNTSGGTSMMAEMDWINLFAMAVSEENAAGGRVVTAPTNGACGIVPAVLAYYDRFISPLDDEACSRFFLASAAIGSLYKMNASISGAEVGCQGEVGVACSMAAAGLAELLGASPAQVCIAAEIGMEHNLGLTCDPVGGQVQVPCIERNAIAAVKAVNATRMALCRISEPRVSLDKVIATMYATGKDMDPKYRETSCGGLAKFITVHRV
ncbi:L-serine ammonia-lyase [Jeongeupia sp. HS-3]|uniref:L-serine ammonia-lyase n=1 Tax=Jeongeupia sp. HS-3 TaxID=1009682 RepID=UPI0018A4675F|nr:L-serine ammonia-lyase [Jeongeupia sp. HS-3]BCL76113.1 L-serine ammonia-lyase [Jeongeupia sp. HS-3]